MEPDFNSPQPQAPPAQIDGEAAPAPAQVRFEPHESPGFPGLRGVFIGSQGLRSGWSLAMFLILAFLFLAALEMALSPLLKARHIELSGLTPTTIGIGETFEVLAIVGAAALVALAERRRSLLAFNLTGPRRLPHLIQGLAVGFTACSALIGGLAWGGWLHFGPAALSGAGIFEFAALWGVVFLLVGCQEEGVFRCFLLFTFSRGINFWWALGLVGAQCLSCLFLIKGNGVWGVYAATLAGLVPCLLVHLKKMPDAGFWQAAWVTSTLFGFVHTFNNGENWIGIFAAALVGFVLCVSVWVTGSAWWAIGFHASFDWAETYFYGTADSGLIPQGHYLTTSPAGAVLWSGGTDGPEGSVLILPLLVLLLAAILVLYGRRKLAALGTPAAPGTPG